MRVPKAGGGVCFALYRCKSLKINTLFATKRDILRQKTAKIGFFVSVFVFCKLSKIREKAKKQKVKRYNVSAKVQKTRNSQKVFYLP
jgi:hypothetical protein